jgi:hypothetical protein
MILIVEDFEKISIRRLKNSNDNHHLYLNNGSTFWMHLTVHCGYAGRQKFRKRIPLGTKDITEARKRRDDLLQGGSRMPLEAQNRVYNRLQGGKAHDEQ